MVIKYLLATLSALANKFTPSSAIDTICDDSNTIALNNSGFNYLNVSPSFGWFRRRKRRMIDLLPKSIIMALVTIVLSSAKLMAGNTGGGFEPIPANSISYTGSPFTMIIGNTIPTLAPTVTGSPLSYSVSPALPAGLTFDTTTGNIDGTPTGTSAATVYTVTANYAGPSTATTTINIQTSATATLTVTGSSVSQVYGAVDPSVITNSSYTITGFAYGDDITSLYSTPSVSTTATNSSNAGTYPVTPSNVFGPSYYNIVLVNGTFTITGAPLTITATGPSETAGVAPTSGTYTTNFTYSGTVNSETITSVTLTFNPTTAQSAGASYTVTPSSPTGPGTFLASNYIITYNSFSGTCQNSYTWKGSTSTTWSTASNWSSGVVPGTNDIVTIPNTVNAPKITGSTTIYSLSFTGNNTITVNSGISLTINKALSVPSGVTANFSMGSTTSSLTIGTNTSAANINNSGNFTVTGGILKVNAGTNYIYNSGVFTVNGSDAFDITGNGTSGNTAIYNAGTFYVGTSGSSCILTFDDSQSIMNLSGGKFYVGPTSALGYFNGSAHDCIVTNQSGGTFTFQSDATGSACVYQSPSSTNKFVGTFTVERYLSGKRGYRLISSPVYSGTTNSINVYSLNYVQSSAYITGTSASGGFDKVTQGPTLYLFREDVPVLNTTFIDGNFQSINNLNSGTNTIPTYTFDYTSTTGSYSIPVGNGFLFFFRGNRGAGSVSQETVTTWPATSVTMSTSGKLNTGQVVFKDWYNTSSSFLGFSNSNVAAKGFNLIGNPYPCNLDLNTYNTTTATSGIYGKNISPFFYELNPASQNFEQYNAVTHVSSGTNNIRYIMSGQGFFALATASGALLNINESAKEGSFPPGATVQNTGNNLFMDTSPAPLAVNRYFRVELAKDTINTDFVLVSFVAGSKATYDPNKDAPYRAGTGKVSLYTMSSDNVALSVSERSMSYQGQTIPLSVNAKTSGTYQLSLPEIKAIPLLMNIWLKDNYLKDSVDMRATANYEFSIDKTDTNTYGSRRFELITTQNPAYAYQLLDFNAHKLPSAREVQVVWDTKYEENYTNFTIERSVDGGQTFTILGGVPATAAGNYGFTDKNPVAGMNLYRLKQEDINNKITYSQVVPIGYANATNNFAQNGINIYPNPASGRINLAIATPVIAAAPSSYSILITNSSGNTLKKVTSNQPYWQGDATGWMPGTYMVKVFDAKTQSLIGTTKFIKL